MIRNKTLTKLTAALLALILVIVIIPAPAKAAEPPHGKCGDNLSWEIQGDKLIIWKEKDDPELSGDMDYWSYTDQWWDNSHVGLIKEAEIMEGVTSIGDGKGFQILSFMERLTIPESMQSIYYDCFPINDRDDEPCFKYIVVHPDNPYYANSDSDKDNGGVLYNKDLTELIRFPVAYDTTYEIPDTVETIKTEAFMYARSLTSVKITANVKTIEAGAFRGCSSLDTVEFLDESTLKRIEKNAFRGDTKLKLESVVLPASLTYVDPTAFDADFGSFVASVQVVPNTVTVIKDSQQASHQAFIAQVVGANVNKLEMQKVIWSVEGSSGVSSISSDDGLIGELIVSPDETARTLTVKAVSVTDTSKSGVAIVTVVNAEDSTGPDDEEHDIDLVVLTQFSEVTEGYDDVEPMTIEVIRKGSKSIGLLLIAITNTNNGSESSFIIDPGAISHIDEVGWDSFAIKPKSGLSAGQYKETVTVSSSLDSSISKSFEITFTVLPKPPTGPGGGGLPTGGGGDDELEDLEDEEVPKIAEPNIPAGSTLVTPEGEDPIENDDGSVTQPGGGKMTLEDGTEIDLPPGTIIDKDGKITIPKDSDGGGVKTPGGSEVFLPPGSVVDPDGSISFPKGSGGGAVTLGSGITFSISEDAVVILDMNAPLGYYISMINPFSDVSETEWYYKDVIFAYAHGLMNGTGTNPRTFSPDMPLSRAMIVTILYRASGAPDVSNIENPFSDIPDVPVKIWFADAVKWAASNGIVNGYGDSRFGPDDNISRQDLATILLRYANFTGNTLPEKRAGQYFNDSADIGTYAKEAVETLYKAQIINGKNGGLFDPKGMATRAEAAAMLHRFIEAM